MSTVGIHGPAFLVLPDPEFPSHAHNLPVHRWMHKTHCSVQRLFYNRSPAGERPTNSMKRNEKIPQDTRTQGRFGTRIGIFSFQNFPQLSHSLCKLRHGKVALRVNKYIKRPTTLVPSLPSLDCYRGYTAVWGNVSYSLWRFANTGYL